MACTSCKKNAKNKTDQLKSGIDSVLNSVDESINDQKRKLGDELLAGSSSILNIYEKIGVTIFAWIPLIFGYYHIIKLVISII